MICCITVYSCDRSTNVKALRKFLLGAWSPGYCTFTCIWPWYHNSEHSSIILKNQSIALLISDIPYFILRDCHGVQLFIPICHLKWVSLILSWLHVKVMICGENWIVYLPHDSSVNYIKSWSSTLDYTALCSGLWEAQKQKTKLHCSHLMPVLGKLPCSLMLCQQIWNLTAPYVIVFIQVSLKTKKGYLSRWFGWHVWVPGSRSASCGV